MVIPCRITHSASKEGLQSAEDHLLAFIEHLELSCGRYYMQTSDGSP